MTELFGQDENEIWKDLDVDKSINFNATLTASHGSACPIYYAPSYTGFLFLVLFANCLQPYC